MSFDLTGKRVFVTGAATGIGRATALAFVNAGARVHICDIDSAALDKLASEQPLISFTHADLGLESDVARFAKEGLDRFGGIDILVNNAGIGGPAGPLETLDSAAWQQTIHLNLNSTFFCCKQLLPLMKAQRSGAIINLSSTAGIMGYPLRTPYAAAKWAVTGLTKSLAMEVGEYGIRVNAICPGPVSGDRMDRIIANEAAARAVSEQSVREAYVKNCSLKQFINPEDIANMILFLSSDAGAKISGQALSVDGDTHSLANN